MASQQRKEVRMKKRILFIIMAILLITSCKNKKVTDGNTENSASESTNTFQPVNFDKAPEHLSLDLLQRRWGVDIRKIPSACLFFYFNPGHYEVASPFGGYITEGTYEIDGDKVVIHKPKSSEFSNYEELFSNGEDLLLSYDYDFKDYYSKGVLKNESVILRNGIEKQSSDDSLLLEGIEVNRITDNKYLRATDDIRMRILPSVNADTGNFYYQSYFMSRFGKKIEINEAGMDIYGNQYIYEIEFNGNLYKPIQYDEPGHEVNLFLKGMTSKILACTVREETIDGITAPWYYISLFDGSDEGIDVNYWIFGGYTEEVSATEIDKLNKNLLDSAIKRGIIQKDELYEKYKRSVNNSKRLVNDCLEIAEKLYELHDKISANADSTEEKKGYYTIYYKNGNKYYSTVVEFVNNDLLQNEKLKIGMNKSELLQYMGEPSKIKENNIIYEIFPGGYGYIITFKMVDNKVKTIECYFEK